MLVIYPLITSPPYSTKIFMAFHWLGIQWINDDQRRSVGPCRVAWPNRPIGHNAPRSISAAVRASGLEKELGKAVIKAHTHNFYTWINNLIYIINLHTYIHTYRYIYIYIYMMMVMMMMVMMMIWYDMIWYDMIWYDMIWWWWCWWWWWGGG